MHDNRALTLDRLARVLRERIRPATHRVVADLRVSAWHIDGGQGEPVPPSLALRSAEYEPFPIGGEWGPPWGTTWFHLAGQVPPFAAGQHVELRVDLGWTNQLPGFAAEGLVYRPDGTVVKALNLHNDWVPAAAPANGDETIDLYVEAAANPYLLDLERFAPTALGDKATAGDQRLYRLVRADVTVLETEVWELVQDLEVLDQLVRELPTDQPRNWHILHALGRALNALDLDDVVGAAKHARAELLDVLSRPAHTSAHQLSAVGHAHIDTAWLWPLRETVRKVARTASNVVNLLDTEADFVFAMSSAQHFAWLQEHRPEVFAGVAEHVRTGRFVPVGSMWVESDTNLPGSEATARQLVHGKRYFLDTFGIDTPEVWLPDSFGFSAALPQLISLAGSRWFLTQKPSWSQTNRFPHHTFWWEGLDGTRIFTHFPPVDTYNAEVTGREVAHAVRNFRDKGTATRSLMPFGYGDGGGGPTREMLARARRTANLEGSPRVTIESPAAFFAAAEQEYAADAPVWVGELYLEKHRGTYTSQAKTKQGNRRAEHLLREAELWCATAAVRRGAPYPYDVLDRVWKTVLLHQFHDILPGSSIAWVHREARDTYARIGAELEATIATAQRTLVGIGDVEMLLNATPHARDGVPALGVAEPQPPARPAEVMEHDGGYQLDNSVLRVVVDGRGLLMSVRDLVADREVLVPGRPANLFTLHTDLPNQWDAWDIDEFYRNSATELVEVESMGLAETATIRVVRRFGQSRLTQDIALQPAARRVDFRVEIDWHEREKLLKVAFPVDVHTDRAAYETQYGHVYRPTHENTSWEAAKFEVCAHRWVHVGEPGYGVAIVNDSTYGHDVRRSIRPGGGTATTVRLSLLRAPQFPDPDTDQGRHEMRYALVAGAEISDAIAEGYALNVPPRRFAGTGAAVSPLVTVEGDNGVVIEAVKLADDRSGDVIMRLYESLGGRATAVLQTSFPVASVGETDLLERAVEPIALVASNPLERRMTLHLRPFQVVTLRLKPGGADLPRGSGRLTPKDRQALERPGNH
jgi:alpha-mannosidase